MGCNRIKMGARNPSNLGGPQQTLATREMSKEDRQRVRSAMNDRLDEAILKLREAGAAVDFCATVNSLRVIWDEIDFLYRDGVISLRVDGQDVSDHVAGVQIVCVKGRFPEVRPLLTPKGFSINTQESK